MTRGRTLAAAVLVALALGVAPAASQAATIITVVNSTSGSALMQTGQLDRDGISSDCAGTLKFEPTLEDTGSTFRYRNHTFRSFMNEPACFEVDISTACTLFSVGYIGTFDPANPLANYAADMGGTAGTRGYSFIAPAGASFGTVIHEVSACAGDYTVTFSSDGPWADNAPAIAGSPAVGTSLTGTNSDWTPGATVTRRWRRCNLAGAGCADIPGATGASYTVTAADLGRTLRFANTATDVDATRTADSRLVEPYLPFAVRTGQSLGAGDRTQSGLFARTVVETRCGVPTSAPGILTPASNYLFDVFPVRSLLNEQVCLSAHTTSSCPSGVTPSIYNPVFRPASGLAANYAGHSGIPFNSPADVSVPLPPAGSREVVVSAGVGPPNCDSYGVTLAADAPFATARPALSGQAAEGGTLAATTGTWSGAPALTRSWRRCDAAGGACAPIPGATRATYSPTEADVGRRLRVRVAATRGRTVSSDSAPSGLVSADPPPRGTVRLSSRNLARAVKRGRIPVRVTCDEACTAVVGLRITRKLAKRLKLKRQVRIARGRGAVAAGRPRIVRAKLTRAARRALRGRRSVRFRIVGSLTDTAGNRSRATRSGAMKRPRPPRRG